MEKRNLSGKELSRLSGIGKSSISRYLSGQYQPGFEEIENLAIVLKIDPRDFFMNENYINLKNIPPEILLKEMISLLESKLEKYK